MHTKFLKSAFQESHFPPPDRPEIAFAGRSNVGKSSLINVLVNRRKMARTSSTPGRTQAINYFVVNDKLYLVDLPGYGFAKVPLSVRKAWGTMVESYFNTRPNLKGVIVILDIRRDPNNSDKELLNWLNEYKIRSIVVLTKSDKLSKNKIKERTRLIVQELNEYSIIDPTIFSAKTRKGRKLIWDKIEDSINS
jgi:GTP-binding protein